MSYNNRSQQTVSLQMAEVVNYSGAPSNSDDIAWNWTSPAHADPALSHGFRASVVFALSILILAGILLNLVTVVTHLQTSCSSLQRTATDPKMSCIGTDRGN